jgi:hypothetical protein
MRSELLPTLQTLQKLVRDELALLRSLGQARRHASSRMPTLVRTGQDLHRQSATHRDVEPAEAA